MGGGWEGCCGAARFAGDDVLRLEGVMGVVGWPCFDRVCGCLQVVLYRRLSGILEMMALGVGGEVDVGWGEGGYPDGVGVHCAEAGGLDAQSRQTPKGLFCASYAHSGCWRPGVRQSMFKTMEGREGRQVAGLVLLTDQLLQGGVRSVLRGFSVACMLFIIC